MIEKIITRWAKWLRWRQEQKLDGVIRMLSELEFAWEFEWPHTEQNFRRYEARKKILKKLVNKYRYNLGYRRMEES